MGRDASAGAEPAWENRLSRTVAGTVVQAGSVLGGIHFHQFEASVPSVPRQLPLPPAHFVNREAELAVLDRVYDARSDRSGLAVLSGMGGVGKTAVALQWMRLSGARFEDGQFYADLAGESAAGPTAPAAVLGGWIRALGIAVEAVPPELEQRVALWRSLVAEKAIAIVLDNVLTAAQVRALLPPSTRSMVVVTTRRRLASLRIDGAALLNVLPLDTPDAVQLLDRTIGDERVDVDLSAAEQLAELCGGLPIALSVMGARLASRPKLALARAAEELRQEHSRLRALSRGEEISVRSVFDVSYDELPQPAQRVYRILGLHPGDEVPIDIVAAATALPADEVNEHLDVLLEANLVEEVRPGRFRLHDLVRLHAKERAVDEEDTADQASLVLRYIESYIAGAAKACELLTPHLRGADYTYVEHDVERTVHHVDQSAALGWLESERANMISGIRTAVLNRWWATAWYLAYVMWPLFRYGGFDRDRLVVDELAVEAAQELGNPDWEGRAVRRLALLHQQRGRYEQAAGLLDRCYELFTEQDDEYGMANTRDAQSVVALAAQDVVRAIELAQQARDTFAALDNQRKVALSSLVIGQGKVRSGSVDEGLRLLRSAQEDLAADRESDPYNAARAELVLGAMLVEAGHLDAARAPLESAERAMDELRSLAGRALSHRTWAEYFWRQGRRALARERLQIAIEFYDHQADATAEALRARLSEWAE